MEIRELNLLAFGPFSERRLEFATSGGGLHIVYGPNEAGKSSSLRALKALLFGIPSRTSDNFLHDNKALRIGGRLRNHNGQELAIVRRKGNKNTLLSPGDDQLDDGALAPYLHGVNAEVFEMLFGIDHEDLVQGGQEILEQKGEVGQALFAASMGSAALHTVLEQLEVEAGDLFKPGGSKPIINTALKEYSRLQKETKERSLSSREWGEAHKALERTNRELEQVQDELVQCKADRNRLRRIQQALPKITARREFQVKIEQLGAVVLLAKDFSKRRESATRELAEAVVTADSAGGTLESLKVQLEAISVNSQVLERSETIEDLHARLGGHHKAMQDRPQLKARHSQLLTDAEELLKGIRPDLALNDAEMLRPVISKGARIAELGSQRQALEDRVNQARKQMRESKGHLQQARNDREELAEAGSPEMLKNQVTLARRQGDLDDMLRAARSELESLEKGCQDDLARVSTLWTGCLDDIPCLPLPSRESIDRFEQDYADLAQRIQQLENKQEEYAETGHEAQKQLDEIQHAGAVPTEQELQDVRTGRGQAWGLIRRHWLKGETVDAEAQELDPDRTLPEAFESRVVDADELADRLRREAERVQKQASLLATLSASRARTENAVEKHEACAENQRQIDVDWSNLWERSSILPLPPREMRAWLDNMEKLRTRMTTLNEQRRLVKAAEANRAQHSQSLQEALRELGEEVPATESLESLLAECEAVAGRIDELARKRQLLDKDIQLLEQGQEAARLDQQETTEALETWKEEWKMVVGGLGLGADVTPTEVNDILDNIRNLFSKQRDAKELHNRIAGIDDDAKVFRDDVASVVARVAPDIAKLPPEDAVAHLKRLLVDAGKDDTRRQQLEEQIVNASGDIKTAKATRKTMTDRLGNLCSEAECKDASELEQAERRSDEYQGYRNEVERLEQELRDIGEGMSLVELEALADAADPDTLPGKIDSLATRIDDELEPLKTELAVAKGEQQSELGLMDGGEDAAALADEAQSALVEVRSSAEQYVRVKLASRILRDEIERYRQQHQGPLLERASEHFTVLTMGSFAGLRTDFNEKDEPVLIGVRPDDERVHVEGMSSGTRDQLYLALRLASLEKYMESAEPMPFIVDDILVHFDDERSRATLGVLTKLAAKTQIILFTHHRRLVEQAQGLEDATLVTVHEL